VGGPLAPPRHPHHWHAPPDLGHDGDGRLADDEPGDPLPIATGGTTPLARSGSSSSSWAGGVPSDARTGGLIPSGISPGP
jgi:hypothetical protein